MNRGSLPTCVAILVLAIPVFVAAEPCAARTEGSATRHAYGTGLEAAVAAFELYRPAAVLADREFTGAILKTGDCFTYAVLTGSRGGTDVIGRIHIPWGEIVGFWHAGHSGAVRIARSAGRGLVSR